MHSDPRIAVEESIEALYKALIPICIISVLVGIITYGIVRKAPPTYEVHFSYTVAMQQRDAASGFRYDGYYSLSGTELFSGTLASIISSPETIVAGYRNANLPLPTQDPFGLQKKVVAEKAAPQLVQVTIQGASQHDAEVLAHGIATATQAAVDAYNKGGSGTVPFAITQTQPWTGIIRIAPLPIGLIVGVFAFVVCSIAVLFREALRRGRS